MNGKKAKKIRQQYRRDLSKEAKKQGKLIGNAMKPKPRFVPMWLWIKGASIFINLKKTK